MKNHKLLDDISFNTKALKNGELEINYAQRSVTIGKKEIELTVREFEILFLLASYPGIVFSHQQIYEAVWGEEYVVDAGNITAHIGHIRKKIGENPRKPVYIQTVHGVGYRFIKQKDE